MKRFSKIILAGAAIAVIGGFGARDVLAKHADQTSSTRQHEQSSEQDRHADRDRRDRQGHNGGHARSGHRENRHAERHDDRRHGWQTRRHSRGEHYGGHAYNAHWQGQRHYAHHINAAYSHGAVHCRPVSRVAYIRGHRALVGGVMCVDRHGIAFVIPQTRHVIHRY